MKYQIGESMYQAEKVFPEAPVSIRGELKVPGDKSISHRSVMFGSLAEGLTEVSGFLNSADCRSTISCFRALGIPIDLDEEKDRVLIHGRGLDGLREANRTLDTGNSGTTTRMISGILAGQNFESHLSGDASIQKRPMKRIMEPLQEMGARITSDRGNDCAPLTIRPSYLKGITYHTKVASAQVKSCILLAGLYADGETTVIEPALSRDHTERMLSAFGAKVIRETEKHKATIFSHPKLSGQKIAVPADISSAAYFLAAGLILPDSEITLKDVNINPTRAGILDVIQKMGGNLSIENKRLVSGEEAADLTVRSTSLHGCRIEGDLIPRLIDEIPVIAVVAAFAEGDTLIRDAAELRVKESDRIQSISENLRAMGADLEERPDGMLIHGGKPLHGAAIQTHMDHRIAMAFTIAGLAAEGAVNLDQPSCVDISYPTFYEEVESLIG
jgi:3-phosphoshikimate 1-carboxyvinyltransferase